MILLLLLLQQQAALPTVGDTLWATRIVRLAPGDNVRAADWSLDGPVQLLGRPFVSVVGEQAEIRYPLVAWEAGNHLLDVPGPIVTHSTGAEDTLQSQAINFQVKSVLPAGVPDSELAVQPAATLVFRGFASVLPALALATLAALVLIPLYWWWGRRGKSIAILPAGSAGGPSEDLIRRWIDAGERRVVAAVAATRLRAALAEQIPAAHEGLDTAAVLAIVAQERPQWPANDLRSALTALDGLRFAPSRADNALELYQRTMTLARMVRGETP